jgi:hypothetical protein
MVTAVETLVLVVVAAAAYDNGNGGRNRVNCGSGGDSGYGGSRQQQKLQGGATINKVRQVVTSSNSGYRVCGSSNCCSTAATAGRGGGVVEVTTIRVRAMATATTDKVVILYPLFSLAMARDNRGRR